MAKKAVIRDVHVERYYPSVLAPAKEFKAIAETENPEFIMLWERFWKWYLNTFVYSLDHEGAARWENMLSIRPKASDTLDERRSEILIKINSTLPYTHRRLEQMLNALCGQGLYEIDLDYDKYNLAILTNPDMTLGINRILNLLRAIVPANLTLDIILQILHQVLIKYSAEITGIVDVSYCFWNRGAATFVRRDAQYKRNGAVRRNKLDPDALYRERQYLLADMLANIYSYHRVTIEPVIDVTSNNDAKVKVNIGHSAESIFNSGGILPILIDFKSDTKATISANHHTNHRTVNQRNKTHARDGNYKRNGRYTQEGLINNLCTVRTVESGVPGRVERL